MDSRGLCRFSTSANDSDAAKSLTKPATSRTLYSPTDVASNANSLEFTQGIPSDLCQVSSRMLVTLHRK